MGPRLHPVRASDRGNPMIHRPYLQSVMGSEITCRHMPFLTCHTCHSSLRQGPRDLPPVASGTVSATKGNLVGFWGLTGSRAHCKAGCKCSIGNLQVCNGQGRRGSAKILAETDIFAGGGTGLRSGHRQLL